MDTAPAVATLSFEGFVLDLRRGSLLTTVGEEIPLRRQSFELLRLLAENAGRLTTPTVSGEFGPCGLGVQSSCHPVACL